jgi:uncharacterized membrane protein YgcG
VVAAAAAANPNLPPLAPASVLALARSACLQRQIQLTLVSGLGVVAPPASSVSGRGSSCGSGRGSSRGSGRGSSCGFGASGRGVSSRGSVVSSHGAGVPCRSVVLTRALS